MKTLIVRIEPEKVPDDVIETVADILLRDGVMAYPTETFYGLGAVCSSGKAVRRIYRLKARDAGKPLSLIVSGLDMIETLAFDPLPIFHRLAGEFWPGPLTLVLKASPLFPARLAGPGHTIGVRIPSVPWLRRLVAKVGLPITATSANTSGEGRSRTRPRSSGPSTIKWISSWTGARPEGGGLRRSSISRVGRPLSSGKARFRKRNSKNIFRLADRLSSSAVLFPRGSKALPLALIRTSRLPIPAFI